MTVCEAGQYVITAPTRVNDLECAACAVGQFRPTAGSHDGYCIQQPRCAAGTHLKGASTAPPYTKQAECTPCAAGQFTLYNDHRDAHCRQQPFCGTDQKLAGAGPASQGECMACPGGTAQSVPSHREAECVVLQYNYTNSSSYGNQSYSLDGEGRPVDAQGNLLRDADGNAMGVNTDGNILNSDGTPLLDAQGNMINFGKIAEAEAKASTGTDASSGSGEVEASTAAGLSTGVLALITLVVVLFLAVTVMLLVWRQRKLANVAAIAELQDLDRLQRKRVLQLDDTGTPDAKTTINRTGQRVVVTLQENSMYQSADAAPAGLISGVSNPGNAAVYSTVNDAVYADADSSGESKTVENAVRFACFMWLFLR